MELPFRQEAGPSFGPDSDPMCDPLPLTSGAWSAGSARRLFHPKAGDAAEWPPVPIGAVAVGSALLTTGAHVNRLGRRDGAPFVCPAAALKVAPIELRTDCAPRAPALAVVS